VAVVAAPAMPRRGNGPMPAISSGFSAMSSTTDRIMNLSGVCASPDPRRPMPSMTVIIEAGMATKITRR
jgi:hypothetical protein